MKLKKKENLDSLLVWDQHFPGLAAVFVWVCESLHRLLFILTVWHHNSRSRTLETAPPYQHNTVLKLCHCLIFTEIPGLPLNFKEINWIQFSSPVKSLSDFFHCLTAHKLELVKFIMIQMFFLRLRNRPGCGYYGTWVNVVFVLSSSVKLGSVGIAMWSLRFVAGDIFCCMVCIYVCVKKTKRN